MGAANAKKGDRVWANYAFLDCPNCTPKTSAGATAPYPDENGNRGPSIYGDHQASDGRICPGGHEVPPNIRVERVIKTGTVAKDGPSGEYGKGRTVWVQWDDEDEPSPNDVFNLRSGEPPAAVLEAHPPK